MKPIINPPEIDDYKEPIPDEVVKHFGEFVKITNPTEQEAFVSKLPKHIKTPFDVYVTRQVKVLMYERSVEKGEDISDVLNQLNEEERKSVEKYISEMKYWMENHSKEYEDFIASQKSKKTE